MRKITIEEAEETDDFGQSYHCAACGYRTESQDDIETHMAFSHGDAA